MRAWARGLLSATVTVATVASLNGAATAVGPEPTARQGKPYPSQAEVVRARKFMEEKADLVGQIEAAQANAYERVAIANEAAEVAAERALGARYEAGLAKKEAAKSVRVAAAARARVESQRRGIALLAAHTYSDGTALNGITTFMGPGGPMSVMDRYSVAQSATQAMKVHYDAFAEASSEAERAERAAARAKRKAAELAAEARTARALASFSTLGAQRAQDNAAQVESTLRADHAKAEKAFRELAQAREDALARLRDKNPENDPGPERALPPAPKHPKKAKVVRGTADSTARVIPRSYPGPRAEAPERDKAAMQRAIDFAMAQLGEPYVWAATGPDRWDCSGFTMAALAQAGKTLPHYSEAQYLTSTPISAADLAPGDLMFWQGRQERINHVAMYIGGGEMIHASGDVQRVNITKVEDFLPPDYFARP